jgi:cytidylate kinase
VIGVTATILKTVAIDGPSAVGKGETAKGVAQLLGVPRLDTGSIYRASALACRMAGANLKNPDECGMVVGMAIIELVDGEALVVNGVDVSDEIRSDFAAAYSSVVGAYAPVRAALIQLQRDAVALTGGVVEGRDIGTVVLPDALFKTFLTASVEARVLRRATQEAARYDRLPTPSEIVAVRASLAERDLRDSSRDVAPLMPASDAIVLDNTGLSLEATVTWIVGMTNLSLEERARSSQGIG